MLGIENIDQLEAKLRVEIGDIVMCTYNTTPHDILDIAVGLYNHYQGINGGMLGPNHVDLAHEAFQRTDLKKSNTCFRVHLIGHGSGDKSKIYNVDGFQTQIPIKNVIDFKVIMKAEEVTKFYRDSI